MDLKHAAANPVIGAAEIAWAARSTHSSGEIELEYIILQEFLVFDHSHHPPCVTFLSN